MGLFDLISGAAVALAATSLGSFGILLLRHQSIGKTQYRLLLAFSAGVMAFSAAEMLNQSHAVSGDVTAAVGFVFGTLLLLLLERTLPHTHKLGTGSMPDKRRGAALLAGTVTIHNIPEGFAIACAFADSTTLGWLVTASIAFQDIPEGMLVSTPLACYGLERRKCVKFGVLSGVVEFAAAILGFLFLSATVKLIPFALAFSAGAMFYVVFEELLPDAFKERPRRAASVSFITGVLAAWAIATLFGF